MEEMWNTVGNRLHLNGKVGNGLEERAGQCPV